MIAPRFIALALAFAVASPGRAAAFEDADAVQSDDGGSQPESAARPSRAAKQNYVGLTLAQDFLLYGSEPAVCPSNAPDGSSDGGAPEYRCFAAGELVPRPVYGPAGNEIEGGLGLATTRLMLGYDRAFGSRLLLGARAGYAFGGAPSSPGGSEFLPLHAELRGALFFGSEPLTGGGAAFYALSAVGLAQVAGRVALEVYVDESAYADKEPLELDAWRTAGNVFVAFGLGAALPLGPGALSAELRLLQLFGTSGSAVSFGLGYAYGL